MRTKLKSILFILILGFLLYPSFSQISEAEYKALYSLFKATSGRNWHNNANWDLTKPASAVNSNWYGLTVKDGHVIKIKLSKNNLIGFIPKEIENFKYLQALDLSNNELYGGLHKVIGNLKKLQILQLDSNQLSGSIPPEIGNLKSLEILNLSYNGFTCGIPSEIGNLSELEWLWLCNIPLGGTIPKEIGKLKNLKVLYLIDCNLTGRIPKEIGNLQNLERIWLCSNKLTGIIPREIGLISNLKEIEFSRNELSGNISHLTKLQNLVFLYIYENRFTFEDLEKSAPYIKTSKWDYNGFDYSKQKKIKSSKTYKDGKIVLDVVIPGKKNTYQWYKNEKLIEGETKTKYFINNSGNNAGSYVCKIKNSAAPKLVLETYEIRIK